MIEESIYTVLSRVSNVTGVDAVVIPQQSPFPRIRYQLVSEEPIPAHSSGERCAIPSYQVDAFGYDYHALKQIAADIRQQMVVATEFGATFISTGGDGYDPDTHLFMISQDFQVWSS